MLLSARMVNHGRSAAVVCAYLMVALYVYEASDVEFTAEETVRLDRLAYSAESGFVAERHGDLLQPGTTALRLEKGVYHFRTGHDAGLRVDPAGAVTVRTMVPSVQRDRDQWPDPPPRVVKSLLDDPSALPVEVTDKDKWPEPPPRVVDGFPSDLWAEHAVAFAAKGSGRPDRVPALTVRYGHDR
ncbi:hypothetical protein [Phytohabitans kaempferiae]|uniref:YkuD domain-containing protein n=1 Tax=Phytohabitans kaempferiae TaxID=1620943 RepID=A0ABV6MEM0_9ACTN